MIATFEGSFSRLIRRFAGISLVVAIAACGGGDSPVTGTTVTQASQRMHPMAVGQATPALPTVAAGYGHSLALKNDGTVWAWGSGSHGQLGNNSFADYSPVPVQVVGPGGTGVLNGASAIAAGYNNFSLALRNCQQITFTS